MSVLGIKGSAGVRRGAGGSPHSLGEDIPWVPLDARAQRVLPPSHPPSPQDTLTEPRALCAEEEASRFAREPTGVG